MGPKINTQTQIVPKIKELSILLNNLLTIYFIQGLIWKIRATTKHNKEY